MHTRAIITLVPLLLAGLAYGADEPLVPPADGKPILQLDAGGPMAAVTALAFAPDGKTLYAGGFDKVVRVWALDEKTGAFTVRAPYHIPIGPGMNGLINALAVSPDGRWLAVAGSGAVREATGFGETGIIVPLPGRLTPAMENDWGAIYLFDLSKDKDRVTPLRGHTAPVLRLKFLPGHPGKPPLLVSVGREGKDAMAVRLWDAAAGRLLAEHGDLPDPGGNSPPALEAWHTGPKAKDVGVAVQLAQDMTRGKDAPPGRLNYWDAGADRLQSTELDPAWQFTNTAAFRSGKAAYSGVLYTGGFWLKKGDAAAGGYVRGWPLSDGSPQKNSDLMEVLNKKGVLKTLVFLPKPDGGSPELAAGVEELPGQSPPYQLALIGQTAAGGFGEVKASAKLWNVAGSVAVTAASPTGDRVAVSGGADHDIWIYSIADLLQNKAEPLQKLSSTGAKVAGVAFVQKGKIPGLLLTQDPQAGGEARTWVLDSSGQGVQEGRKGWEDDGPDLDGWKVASDDGKTFSVEKEGRLVGRVHLATGQPEKFRPLLPQFALLPPCKPLNKALLAVAYVEQGVAYLELFDVVADRRLRRFFGHVNAVRSLAFSKDGRLLASASEDQTVAVWSLTDLDKVVAKGGSLPGLMVEQKNGKVVVAALDEAALSADNQKVLADKKVAVGDAVEGVVVGKALKAFKTPQDLYDAAWGAKPGDSVVLRIAGGDITLKTDQGEDERKPLFSFFMSDEARNRLWLAWTPIGPYDTADQPAAEKVIGWHSNTGKASAPVEFSPAAQYRKESYRPGLLKHLFAEGDVSNALKKWNGEKGAKPDMSLRLEAPKTQFPQDAQGRVLVQGPPKGLALRAELFGVLASKVRRVRWRFDGGDWRDFERQSELAFTSELEKEKLDWRGRPHEFSLLVETLEDVPTEYTRRLPISYAPPRPEITSDLVDGAEVAAREFPFKAAATPGVGAPAGAKLLVTVRLNNGEPKAVGAEISEKLPLVEGDNFIEVRAMNEDAGSEPASAEIVSRLWRVHYTQAKQIASPTVYLESVSSASDKPQDNKPLVVHTRTVRIRGRITSTEPVVEAACDGHDLAAPGADKLDLRIDEQVALKAVGEEQKVQFVARNAKSEPTTKTLVLKYEPPAPRFEFDKDKPAPTFPRALNKVPLGGRILKADDDPSETKVEVRVNGAAIDGVKRDGDRLDASFAPRLDDNVVEVVLSNPFDRRTETVHCRPLRSPVVTRLEASNPGAGALVDLTAVVQSPADRPLIGARVANDQIEGPSPKCTLTPQPPLATGADLQTWKVAAVAVPLKNGGKNRLTLWARNEDGESDKPAETVATLNIPAPQAAPVVEVLDPRIRDQVVQTPQGRLAFRVRWPGQPGKVAVLINDREQAQKEAGLTATPPDAEGAVTYRTDALPLESGPNIIRIAAVNADGMKGESEPYTVFYLRGTAFIRLTGLSAGRPAAPQVQPLGHGDQCTFPRQDAAEVWVHGEVEWPDETDAALSQEQPPHMRVWVNDFEQFETPLEARRKGGRVRTFAAPLRLNNTVNRIEIGSSDVKVEKATFTVQCSQPARDQRLHLLVVAPGRRDDAKVSEEVLKAFQARHIDGDHFDTAAFRDGRMYGPVIKLAQREEVFDAVETMKGAISGGADELNDVIVVFFQGEQVVTDKEHFLLTGETLKLLPPGKSDDKSAARLATLRETALTCDKFREMLADMRGAKLVLLDAQELGGLKDAQDRVREILDKGGARFPKIGCLDYVLLGAESPNAGDHLVALLQKSLQQSSSLKDLTVKEDAWSRGPNQLFRCYVPEGLLSLTLAQVEK